MKIPLLVLLILLLVVILIICFALGFVYRKKIGEKKITSAEELSKKIIEDANEVLSNTKIEAENIINTAKNNAKEILINAKEESIGMKIAAEQEIRKQKDDLKQYEDKLFQREDQLANYHDNLVKQEQEIREKTELIETKIEKINNLEKLKRSELEKISNLDTETAKKIFLEDIKNTAKAEAAKIIRDIESKTKQESDIKIIDILKNAMQRCNIEHITDTTVSVVILPSDDMKGKIIGREGRNIRKLENITGVDIIIDDTPEEVIVSAFSPKKRAIAKLALEKLLVDGRIHPSRIETMVEKAKNEIEDIIYQHGETATYETGVQNLHPELIKLLGQLEYRTSYGQNALKHSIEVSHLCGTIANEIGCNVITAKRAGLLHDIGKAVDHDIDGSHVQIGALLAKKFGEPLSVINAIEAHHNDVEPQNVISVIVQIADAISAARPGARREALESYIKRLEKLESIPESFECVEKAFAIHAGRELRIIVIPEKIDDDSLLLLAKNIAKRVENELEYPGQIKINVIRETKAVEYAN